MWLPTTVGNTLDENRLFKSGYLFHPIINTIFLTAYF